VEAFYAARRPELAPPTGVLVLSADGKGVVMRPEALRAATGRAARSRKLSTRLSKGEKRDRKRMAEVAAVYDLTPSPRPATSSSSSPPPPPVAAAKRPLPQPDPHRNRNRNRGHGPAASG